MAPDPRVVPPLERGTTPAPTVALHSFGCKLNQCESAGIRSRFVGAGFRAVGPESDTELPAADAAAKTGAAPVASRLARADVHVVNTCSVTGRADAQARQLVRKLIREQPASRVVVTGCYAQRAPQEIARIPGVYLVAGNGEKDRLHAIVGGMMAGEGAARPDAAGPAPLEPLPPDQLAARVAVSDLRKTQRSFDLSPVDFGERTRAYLRVQDGCDAGCTFCIIPRIRGRSTSLNPIQAVERARALLDAGYREIILTGIHLGMYGHDRRGPAHRDDPAAEGPDRHGEMPGLAGLIDAIHHMAAEHGRAGAFRLRLSSIEPQEIEEALIDRIAEGKLVPHLHIPLQSGSDRVLAAMNRTYRAAEYDAVLRRLTSGVDPIGLGADVIVGFPGETDADFEATFDFIAQRPFTYLHVFPFSPRPGTRAATLPGRPPGDMVDARSARLRALSDEKRRTFAARFVGREVDVLVEEPAGEDGWEGWTGHYVRTVMTWPSGDDLTGRLVAGRALDSRGESLRAAPRANLFPIQPTVAGNS